MNSIIAKAQALAAVVLLVAVGVIGATVVHDRTSAADIPSGADYVPVGNSFRASDSFHAPAPRSVPIGSPVTNPQCFRAVEANVTFAPLYEPGWVAAWGAGAWPGTSLVNSNGPGIWQANASAISVFSVGQQLYIQVYPSTTSRVIIDVMGWYRVC